MVFDSAVRVSAGGLALGERAALAAARAGLEPVRVWGPEPLATAAVDRLRARGVAPRVLSSQVAPFEAIGRDEYVVLVGPNVLVEPAALADLAAEAGHEIGIAHLVRDGGVPVLALLPPCAVAAIRGCRSIDEVISTLASRGSFGDAPLARRFCRRVERAALVPDAERAYLRHTNGGASESFFTKIIRRFSVPLSRRLAWLGVTPTQVTAGGFVLACASAWCFAQGDYAAGLTGAALYYASMIFDCSDGEVARLTLRDSPFGAWLETMVDYATYFLVLGGLAWASVDHPAAGVRLTAALIALIGSIVVAAAASYLRHRVASADPGQFDESSAHALASASPVHRFASWSRQWIKRSSIAHLLVVLAVVNGLPWLLYLWAFGASVASVAMLIVGPFVVRRVVVAPIGVRNVEVGR
jgi:phosphatidylglycerophosphate synthase